MVQDMKNNKAAEVLMDTSEQRLRKIVEIIPVAIAEIDCQGQFQFINPAYSRIFEYSVPELKKLNIQDLAVTEEKGRQLLSLLEQLAREQPPPYRWNGQNRTRSGSILDVVVDWDYIRDNEGRVTGFLTAITDVTEQHRQQTELAASRQRCQAMFDNIHIGLAAYEPVAGSEDFVIVEFNRAAEEIEKISRDQVIGCQVTEVFPGVRQLGLLEVFARVNRTGRAEHLPCALYQDGHMTGWRENYVFKLPTGEIVAAYEDATNRMRALQALHESKEKYRTLFENASLGIFRSTFAGRFLEVNPALAEMLGYESPAEVIESISDIGQQIYVQPENRQEIVEGHKLAAEAGHYCNRYRRKDGTEFIANLYLKTIYDSNGEPLYLEGIVEDITTRIRMEEELRASEIRFRSLVEYSADHIFMLDREGRYLFSNDRVTQFNAAKGDTLVGKPLDDLYPPDLAARYHRLLDQVFTTGTATSFEHEIEEPDGRHFHIDTLYPIYKNGHIWAAGGICRDITTQKQYEDELRHKTTTLKKAFQDLRQTQRGYIDQEKHRALSQMASGIAHDFNNSLSSMLGFSDLLLQSPEKIKDPETVTRYVKMIHTAATEASQIVRRLRKFYRPSDKEALKPVDINLLTEEAVALTEPVWKHKAQARGVTIRLEKDFGEPALVNGNPSELHETITNLILNAVDAMPRGGRLRLASRAQDDWLFLAISDTGTGMNGEIRNQCLNPFYTTKGEAGSGLGLSVAQGIVVRHGGQIEIDSTTGQGTTFVIRLPLAVSKSPHKPGAQERPPDRSCLKILVVEDEPHQRQLLTEYLQKDNHQVTTAVNGIAGMQKFYNHWFDLVLTDQAMPEMHGDALARNIKAVAPGKPIVMITGFGDLTESGAGKPPGVDLVISKPVTLGKLRQALAQVLAGPGKNEEKGRRK